MDAIADKRNVFMKSHPEIGHDLSRCRIEFLKSLALEDQINQDWIEDAFQIYYEARQKVSLYEDAFVLDELKDAYRLVAVTNGNSDIDKTGVGHWFEFSVSAADVGYMKPHPAIFEKVLEKAKIEADEVLHIGDDSHHDVFGASQAGIRSIWLNRNGSQWQHTACEADFHIQSLMWREKYVIYLLFFHLIEQIKDYILFQ